MSSPTARTLALLRRRRFIAAVVEKWIPQMKRRLDVWGFGDILAAHPDERAVVLVQATSASNVAARLTKARGMPELAAWLRAGGRFEVWGWGRRGGRWQPRIVAVRAEDLATVVVQAPPRRPPGRKRAPGTLFPEWDGPDDAEAPAARQASKTGRGACGND